MKPHAIRILLVEDHAVVREGIRDLLRQQSDMEVIGEAADGAEGVRMARQLKPDLILMDISLPILNGIEATRQIKAAVPSVSILVLTAYDNEEFIFAILQEGAAGYLLKNVRGQELLHAIRSVYQGESVLHPAIIKKVMEGRKPVPEPRDAGVLSRRELQVVEWGAQGLTNKEIATRLTLGERTIQSHWRNIFNKLGVGSRVEAIMQCLKKEWIAAPGTAHE